MESILKTFSKFNWIIEDWVILDNHYHLMVDVKNNPNDLSKIIRNIHRFTAMEIRKIDSFAKQADKIWYNYWDTCITYENSYNTRINYIWFNPVKHGYVDDPKDWKFGSYYYRYDEEADEMKEMARNFPFDKAKIFDLE